MRVSDSFRSFVVDQLEGLDDLIPRSMFGGVGLYCSGTFFGIIAADTLYLKVDDVNRSDYERVSSKPFKPYADRSGTMQYWMVPLEILESPPALIEWARKSVAAAERAHAAGRRPQGRRARRTKPETKSRL